MPYQALSEHGKASHVPHWRESCPEGRRSSEMKSSISNPNQLQADDPELASSHWGLGALGYSLPLSIQHKTETV